MNNSNDFDALYWYIKKANIQVNNYDKTIIYNAIENPKLKLFNNPLCIQRYYPDYKRLSDSGFCVSPVLPSNYLFDFAIIIASKHKEDNLLTLAKICMRLNENGMIIIVSKNEIGGKSLVKYAYQLFGLGEIEGKHHCTIFKTFKNNENLKKEVLKQYLNYGKQKYIDGYLTLPGVFSEGKIDIGSKLFIEIISGIELIGDIADFGAGWGYLSGELLKLKKGISSITLIEADYYSLELAKQVIKDPLAKFVWGDVIINDIKNKYDNIITNPPFHYGSFTDTNIGIQFITSAYRALKYGKSLYLVANKKLPYENSVKTLFGNVKLLADKDGYKVLKAVK